MSQIVDENSPFLFKIVVRLIILVLIVSGLFILPLSIFLMTGINFNAAVILLNEDGYSRQKYYITEYTYFQNQDIEGSGGDAFDKYFVGKVNDKQEYLEDFTFVRYSSQLARIIDNSPLGTKKPLEITIDIWYNSDMGDLWLTRKQKVIPYTPDFFSSIYDRLRIYACLWVLFIVVWLLIIWLPKIHDSLTKKKHNNKYRKGKSSP